MDTESIFIQDIDIEKFLDQVPQQRDFHPEGELLIPNKLNFKESISIGPFKETPSHIECIESNETIVIGHQNATATLVSYTGRLLNQFHLKKDVANFYDFLDVSKLTHERNKFLINSPVNSMLCDNGGMLFNLIEKKANKNLPLSQPAKYIPQIDEYVMGLMNGTVIFYDKTGLKIKSFNCDKGYLLRLVVDNALLLYNPKTGINQLVDFNFKKIVEFKSQSANSLFVYSSPLKTIFQAWHKSAINCYNISTNKTSDIYTHDTKKKGYKEQFQSNDFGIHRMTLSPDGMFLAVASTYNKNVLWDLSKLTKFDLIGHNCNPRNTWDGVRSVSFSQNSEYVLTSADDYSSIIWNKVGKPLSRLKGHKRKVIGSSFFDNDSGIVSISLDNTLKIWRK